MNWLDIVLLAFIGVVGVAGYRQGLVQAGAALVGILAGITIASRYGGDAGDLFSRFTGSQNALEVLGFLLVFLLSLAASLLLSALVARLLKAFMLAWVDRLGGLALGAVIAAAAGSALLANVQHFPVLELESTIADAPIGSFLADNLDVVLRGTRILPEGFGA